MGYTHYWRISGNSKELKQTWEKIVADCQLVCELITKDGWVNICFEYNQPKKEAKFGKGYIRFNGRLEDGCETFFVKPALKEFDFCKTRGCPYDLCVTACLIVLKKHWGDKIRVSSDGDGDHGWTKAAAKCQEVLGYGGDFVSDGEKEALAKSVKESN